MQQVYLLVIDDISMGHKHIFECLDRCLRDVRECNKPFGGFTVLLSGDWKQILPVGRHSVRSQIVDAVVKRSFLWNHTEVVELTINLRLLTEGHSDEKEFANYLLDIGIGNVSVEQNLGEFKMHDLCF
ncbi:ATP-dependent DNA helicase [Octopus vulgaris]|uniref:ATP-dependent DNA helicase n=1 Tax=Octopus vulgaris TaxID=6645 RepID=A0AA36EVP9_OCTVU|nr:ATP-dependent DNA helicase [Octopus vulgaris]